MIKSSKISNALSILMLCKKICIQQLFESAFCIALISQLVRKRIPDGRTDRCRSSWKFNVVLIGSEFHRVEKFIALHFSGRVYMYIPRRSLWKAVLCTVSIAYRHPCVCACVSQILQTPYTDPETNYAPSVSQHMHKRG